MNLSWDTITDYVICTLVYVGVPFCLIVLPGIPFRWRFMPRLSAGKGALIATLLMWFLMHGLQVEMRASSSGPLSDDSLNDGTAVNAVLLLFGWLIALLFQVPHLLLRSLLESIFFNRRFQRGPKPEGMVAKIVRQNESTPH